MPHRVLIYDASEPSAEMILRRLKRSGYSNSFRIARNIEEAKFVIRFFKPDMLISDAISPENDSIEAARLFRAEIPGGRMICISNADSDRLAGLMFREGFECYLLKPVEQALFNERIYGIPDMLYPNAYAETPYERATQMLLALGVPANLIGFRLVREAILIAYRDLSAVGSVTEKIYEPVAKKFNTTPSRMERNMRHAIEAAWVHGSLDYIDECFGYTVDASKGKPTNTAFIATVADRLRLEFMQAD